jgi:hypothetical protein
VRRRLHSWRAAFVWSVALLGLTAGAARTQTDGPPYPRLANMYLHGSAIASDIPLLARWDVLILDASWPRSSLQQLRTLNPDIKIFYYVCPYCMQVPPPPGETWRQENYDYAQANDLWWRNWNQTIASDWPETQLVNVTGLCPAGPQGNWRQFIAARTEQLMRDNPELDGVFYDNYWKTIGWEQGGTIQVDSDCNPTHNPAGCDSMMDSDARVDSLWNAALLALAQDTRQRFDAVQAQRGGRPLGIVTNSSTDYFPYLNGTLHEYFPNGAANPDPGNVYGYNWNQEMLALPGGYLVAPFSATPYTVSVLNADWSGTWSEPDRSPEFERHKRFTLASALMGDGYYSLDAADTGHGNVWWEPEYDLDGASKGYLGYPLGPMERIGVPSGPERITNGSFTNGATGWETLAFHATGSLSIDSQVTHTSPGAARIQLSSLTAADGSFKLYQTVQVESGHGYTLSFWARASVAQDLVLHLYSPSCPSNRCLSDQHVQLGTTWQRYEIPFVASGTAAAGFNLFVSVPGTVWLDDLSMREGDASVYRRNFENGIVLLNYTTEPRTVDLGGTYRHLTVAGSSLYDGAAVTQETLVPSDGRILLTSTGTPPPTPRPLAQTLLLQNQPNPFNPVTRIRFRLAKDEHVHLAVYDIAGRLVRTLVNRNLTGGVEHGVTWNGKNRLGVPERSGIYIYRITTPSFSESRKMTLLQ